MPHLILSRRAGQRIRLSIKPGADPQALLEKLMEDGIWISVYDIESSYTRLSFEAPAGIEILREEILPEEC